MNFSGVGRMGERREEEENRVWEGNGTRRTRCGRAGEREGARGVVGLIDREEDEVWNGRKRGGRVEVE